MFTLPRNKELALKILLSVLGAGRDGFLLGILVGGFLLGILVGDWEQCDLTWVNDCLSM